MYIHTTKHYVIFDLNLCNSVYFSQEFINMEYLYKYAIVKEN